jgi:tetratricopeptide (TPR) repeat protein
MSWPGLAKGLALGEHGKYDEAIKAYDEAIRLNPNYAMAWNNNGLALGRYLGKYEEASQCFDRAIRLNPNLAVAWNNKGIALRNQGKYDESIKAYDEAIRLDPKYAEAWCNEGIAFDDRESMMKPSWLIITLSG